MNETKPCSTCKRDMVLGEIEGRPGWFCTACWREEEIVEPRQRKLPGLGRLPREVMRELSGSFESPLEDEMYQQIELAGLPLPTPQYRFSDNRKWRCDFAWPDRKLALEVEGGVYTKGRHQRPLGFLADCEKYNFATIRGWRVLRVARPHIRSGEALAWVEAALDMPRRVG